MNAEMVRASLARRWPDGEYLSIYEAPDSCDRGGRKLDVLVASLWRSRGLTLDGVEVKVSPSDWKRELEGAAKADFWWRHTNRFWVAVPEHMADRVASDLPPTWGLLACPLQGKPRVRVQAPHREAEPLPWPVVLGCLRAAADAGVNALYRARQDGRSQGYKEAEERIARQDGRKELTQLRERCEAFKAATGIDIERAWSDDLVTEYGETVRLVVDELRFRGSITAHITRAAEEMKRHAERSLSDAKVLGAVVAALSATPLPAQPSLQPQRTEEER